MVLSGASVHLPIKQPLVFKPNIVPDCRMNMMQNYLDVMGGFGNVQYAVLNAIPLS